MLSFESQKYILLPFENLFYSDMILKTKFGFRSKVLFKYTLKKNLRKIIHFLEILLSRILIERRECGLVKSRSCKRKFLRFDRLEQTLKMDAQI